jgi:hypothetical protein
MNIQASGSFFATFHRITDTAYAIKGRAKPSNIKSKVVAGTDSFTSPPKDGSDLKKPDDLTGNRTRVVWLISQYLTPAS